MPTEVLAVLAGGVITLITLGLTIYASRRFGLPGLAREVDTQQDKLIKALQENNTRLAGDNRRLRSQNKKLGDDNQDLRAKLALAYADIAALYKGQGKSVPNHVLETMISLKEPVAELEPAGD